MRPALAVLLLAVLLLAPGVQAAKTDDFQRVLRNSGLPASLQLPPGQPLTPGTAEVLWRELLNSSASPRTFAPRTVLARLLREVLSAGRPLTYSEVLLFTARFRPLVVARPDGYCTVALTGKPLARLGYLSLRQGELYSQGLRVGSFYFDGGGAFFPVDAQLRKQNVPPVGERGLGHDPATTALLGAQDAVEEMAQGLATIIAHPVRTIEGLAQLPATVSGLLAQSPEYFARYQGMNREDQLREAARLTMHVLTLRGGAAAAGPRLAEASRLPVLTLSARGELVVSELALPSGTMTAVVGAGAASASLVLLAQGSGPSGSGTPWSPAAGGPGQWTRKAESMSAEAQRYQSQVTGTPEGWVYRIRTGQGPKDFVDFDGFKDSVLLEVKGPGYLALLKKMHGKRWFEGIDEMISQAQRQFEAAGNTPLQWHFAEREVADVLQTQFELNGLTRIKVIHTPVSP